MKALVSLLVMLWISGLAGCASTPRKTPELSSMVGKKVALVELDGEASSRSIIEVSLVNQLRQRGTFLLLPKQDIEAVRGQPDLNPTDWKELARRAGAEYALRAKVLQFDADTREGYNEEEIEDSQLEAERGDGRTKRLFKVKSLTGQVRIELEFTELTTSDTRVGIAEAHDEVRAEARASAAHLPPKLRFLEKLANEAFRAFFDRYQD
ncbi:MAG: hypothetical protein NDJ90_10755 [Oligoflexia bacterium]|nr:hypothetical protein [Oligoflexia bacterium]